MRGAHIRALALLILLHVAMGDQPAGASESVVALEDPPEHGPEQLGDSAGRMPKYVAPRRRKGASQYSMEVLRAIKATEHARELGEHFILAANTLFRQAAKQADAASQAAQNVLDKQQVSTKESDVPEGPSANSEQEDNADTMQKQDEAEQPEPTQKAGEDEPQPASAKSDASKDEPQTTEAPNDAQEPQAAELDKASNDATAPNDAPAQNDTPAQNDAPAPEDGAAKDDGAVPNDQAAKDDGAAPTAVAAPTAEAAPTADAASKESEPAKVDDAPPMPPKKESVADPAENNVEKLQKMQDENPPKKATSDTPPPADASKSEQKVNDKPTEAAEQNLAKLKDQGSVPTDNTGLPGR